MSQNEIKTIFIDNRNKSEEISNVIQKIQLENANELCIDLSMYTTEDIEKIKSIFLEISKLNIKPNILIRLHKICELDLMDIGNYENLNFRIVIDDYTYNYEELNMMNLELKQYLTNIVNASMSPYEKYISIYNFVRKYKKYKIIEQPELIDLSQLINNKHQSSSLKYILENDYIDCRGFSYLLQTMLNMVGIESVEFGFDVYRNDGSKLGGHARTLINIDDDKYDLHGIYVSDATWDANNLDSNLEYSLLPLSSMRNEIYGKCETTLLFDSLNTEEFKSNINELCSNIKYGNSKLKVLEMICSIDKKKALELSQIDDNDEFYQQLMNYILLKNNHKKMQSDVKVVK